MTTLTEREQHATVPPATTHGAATDARPGGSRRLLWLTIVLAVALIGLGAWVIADRISEPATAPSDEIAQVMDDYIAAWNDYDGDAFSRLVTDDFVMTTAEGTNNAAAQAIVINNLGRYEWHVTEIGERLMAGSGPWYITQVDKIETTLYSQPVEGLTVLTIVDDGGVLRVAAQTFFGNL